jgi:hypothetical protein
MSQEIGTTSLDTLPNINEIRDTPANNPTNELNKTSNNSSNQSNDLDVNRFVNDLQKASVNGGLSLPSRDIPQNPNNITNDETIKENYIPKINNNDYISDYQTNEEIINQNYNKDKNLKNIDNIYNQISTPLLISLLYFLFQLPVVRNNFYKLFPMCYNVSGNFNILGYITNSLLFGLIYFVLNYLLHI